jgi:alpha-tubulin suppressor-like RCC1 family protein
MLGYPHTRYYANATAIAGVADARAVAAGDQFGCALIADGSVRCFGTNQEGQLGDGTTVQSLAAAPVVGIVDAVALAASWRTACAVLGGGGVVCWGEQLAAEGQTFNVTAPVTIDGSGTAKTVALGHRVACLTTTDDTLACWGENLEGALGQPADTLPGSVAAVAIPGLTGVNAVSVGDGFWCGLLADGAVRCAGDNANNALGAGAGVDGSTVPIAVSGVAGAVAISSGLGHSCALLATGAVKCWGSNTVGALGDGTTTQASTIVESLCVTDAVQIAAGALETCALRAGGTVACWGDVAAPAREDFAHPDCAPVSGG